MQLKVTLPRLQKHYQLSEKSGHMVCQKGCPVCSTRLYCSPCRALKLVSSQSRAHLGPKRIRLHHAHDATCARSCSHDQSAHHVGRPGHTIACQGAHAAPQGASGELLSHLAPQLPQLCIGLQQLPQLCHLPLEGHLQQRACVQLWRHTSRHLCIRRQQGEQAFLRRRPPRHNSSMSHVPV